MFRSYGSELVSIVRDELETASTYSHVSTADQRICDLSMESRNADELNGAVRRGSGLSAPMRVIDSEVCHRLT